MRGKIGTEQARHNSLRTLAYLKKDKLYSNKNVKSVIRGSSARKCVKMELENGFQTGSGLRV